MQVARIPGSLRDGHAAPVRGWRRRLTRRYVPTTAFTSNTGCAWIAFFTLH